MEPVVTAAAIGAAGSLIAGGTQAYAQGKMNKKTREWNEKMYQMQKADNLELWNRANAYNSPQAQMARLRDAGLNPHLIYGNSPAGASGQATTGDAPSPGEWNPKTPDFSFIGDSVAQYQDARLKGMQTSNLGAQTRYTDAKTQTEGFKGMLENVKFIRAMREENRDAGLDGIYTEMMATSLKQAQEMLKQTGLKSDNIIANTDYLKASEDNLRAKTMTEDFTRDWKVEEYKGRINRWQAQTQVERGRLALQKNSDVRAAAMHAPNLSTAVSNSLLKAADAQNLDLRLMKQMLNNEKVKKQIQKYEQEYIHADENQQLKIVDQVLNSILKFY